MELRAGYKNTEVGIIPNDWNVFKLGDCLLKNPDYGINAAAVEFDDTLPTYLRITDISEDGKFISSNKVSVNNSLSNSYYLEKGDIVFARTGASVGKTYLYNENDGRLVFAGFLIRIKANPELVDYHYLIYLTQTKKYRAWVSANSMRSGQPGLNSNEYKSFQILLPPTLTEQTAIATALSDADALISGLEKLIAKKRNIKQGAMQKLLNPMVNDELLMVNENATNSQLKKGWEVKKLGDIGECIIGLTYTPANIKESGTLVLRSSNVQGCSLKYEDNVFVDSKIPEKLINQENDILICVRNGSRDLIGKCALLTGKAIGETFGAFMSVYRSPYNQFVFILFQSAIIKKQIDEHLGATINQITNKSLNSFEIPFPPIEEQTRIANILSDMDNEITGLETKLEKYKKVKLGMMQELLTGKIRLI